MRAGISILMIGYSYFTKIALKMAIKAFISSIGIALKKAGCWLISTPKNPYS
jgi:hypothetical protein